MQKSKVCIVTGGSRGIGKGIATELAEDGHIVYITGRNIDDLNEVAKKAGHCEGTIRPIECDHEDDEQVEGVFAKVVSENDGRLDLLVNNAFSAANFMIENSHQPFWDLPADTWDVFNNVGLRNHYRCTVLASRIMVHQGRGLIVNITSLASFAYSITPCYSIGKGAVDRMTSDCAIELRKYNVAMVSLWPGSVRTEYALESVGKEGCSLMDNKEALYCIEHGESPSFVGKAVTHLLRDKNIIHKTGQVISTAQIAEKYRLTDNGKRPFNFLCLKDMMALAGYEALARFIPEFIQLPRWLFGMLLKSFAADKAQSIYS